MSSTRSILRPVAVAIAGVLALTTVLGAAPAQAASAASADRGGDWLADQLTDGLVVNDQFDFTDHGLSIDVGLALDEIGGRPGTVTEIRDAVAPHVESYTTDADFGGTDIYANSVAKLTRFVQVAGGDPRGFGGEDLVAYLNGRVVKQGPARGRITDRTADPRGSDFASTIGQAFAVGALHRADSRLADRSTRFLVAQQCRAGGFRLGLTGGTPGRPQACGRGAKLPSVDATALVVLELSALPRGDRTVATRSSVRKALSWLQSAQRRNGSFGSDSFITVSNTNSTGLAGWALGSNGRCRDARQAAGWVRDLQVPSGGTGTPLAGESGAIAYDRAAYGAGETDGIPEEQRDQWRRASAQAAPALLFVRGC